VVKNAYKDDKADAVDDECLLLQNWHCASVALLNSCDCKRALSSSSFWFYFLSLLLLFLLSR